MLKREISKPFKISVLNSYNILKKDEILVRFEYKDYSIIGIYPSKRDKFL